MLFKKSKKKQLEEIKYQLFLLRDGLRVQKALVTHRVTYCTKIDDITNTIERLYDYMIERIKEIEDMK